jgi:ATP-dependent Clp protease adaptor protein ClpS
VSEKSPDMQQDVSIETDEEVVEPSMYRVLLHNDDYTTMDFVIEILIGIFHKTFEQSTLIMLNVHKAGTGLCGVYTFEVAETKVDAVQTLSRENGFPLKCTMEKE